MEKDKGNDKEIYKLWVDFLRKKGTFKTAVVQFNRLDIFRRLHDNFRATITTKLKSKKDVLNHNARIHEKDEILRTVLASSLIKNIKNRETLICYLLYYLFFYDIFADSYSFENWWVWQTNKGTISPPNMETDLLSTYIVRWGNGKPVIESMDLKPPFFRPISKRRRLPELKVYLEVYELREVQKMKWLDIIKRVEPDWLDREINRNVERTYYNYLEKAKNILENLDWGLFPKVTIPHSTNIKNR